MFHIMIFIQKFPLNQNNKDCFNKILVDKVTDKKKNR